MNQSPHIIDTKGVPQKRRFVAHVLVIALLAGLGATIWFFVPQESNIKAAAGDVILMWEGDDIPAGWECVSCSATGTLFGAFPRGSSTFGAATSSADSHNHSAAFSAHTQTTSTVGVSKSGTNFAADTHTHTVSGISITNNDHRPPFKNLRFIRATDPATLPNGTIGMFKGSSSTLPANWTYYSAASGNYVRGDTATTTGGAAEHSHALSATADASTGAGGGTQGGTPTVSVAADAHTHAISGAVANASNTPPYREVVFARLTTTSSLPVGLIALFDASVPQNWTSLSGAGGDFNGMFLRGAETYGGQGGSSTHNHATTTILSQNNVGATTNRSGANIVAADPHTHDFVFNSFSQQSSLPVYRDVVVGEFDGAPNVRQMHYHWRNDDDSETLASSATGGSEDTSLSDMLKDTIYRVRFGISNEGTSSSLPIQYRLEFASSTGGPWTAVPSTSGAAFIMASTSQLVEGASTTNIATSTGGVSDENGAFRAGQQKENNNETSGIALSETEFTELEYAIQATQQATSGWTYYFRVSDAGSDIGYDIYASTTIGAERIITVAATGTQIATTTAPSTDFYTGGAFTLVRNLESATVTQIIITASGTINADAYLSNARLYYETAASCSYEGNETLFGSSTSFSSSRATISGLMSVSTSQRCMYVVLDVASSTPAGQTIDIQITDPSADTLVSEGGVEPSTIEAIGGVTTVERRVITVAATGSQVATSTIPSTDLYMGGAFTLSRDGETTTVTSITITASGTVAASTSLTNVDIYYETSGACSYGGGETLFGTAASFDINDKATITGSMPVGVDQVCVYMVLDVGSSASGGETVEVEISDPSSEVVAAEGDVSPATTVAISGATTLEVAAGINVGADGAHIASSVIPASDLYIGGAFTFARNAGNATVTQIIISEKGSIDGVSDLSNARLYYETTGICSYDGGETLFGSSSSFTASGTKQIATISGSMNVGTSQLCVYMVVDIGSGAADGETIAMEITDPSTEVSASQGDVNPNSPVAISGEMTLEGPKITVGATGTQIASTSIPSLDVYTGGAFTFVRNTANATITSITVTASGTVDAQANLNDLRLYYETAGSCSYNGTEALFGSSTSFNVSGQSTVTGSMNVGTSQVCLYAVLDVGEDANDLDTVELAIADPSSDVVASAGGVEPATPVEISGTTELQLLPIQYTQLNYRFYASADDVQPGSALASENAQVTDIASGQHFRLRFNILIEDAKLPTSTQTFRLQYAELGAFGSCESVPGGNFANVGAIGSSTIWRGYDYGPAASDGDPISSVLLSSSTVPQTYEEQTPSVSNVNAVSVNDVAEWDWALYNNAADSGTTYCFRMALSGSSLDNYTNVATLVTKDPATWDAPENTATTTDPNTNIRLRIELSNEGNTSTTHNFSLEYAQSTAGPWTSIPYDAGCTATSTHFRLCLSDNFVDGDPTTNQLTAEATTFVPGYMIESSTSTDALTLDVDEFTEIEWNIQATDSAQGGGTYYFRVTNPGTPIGTYAVYPQLTLSGGPPVLTQNYYRFYVDNDQIDPNDPWPAGVSDLGENVAITASDDPPGLGEVMRIRMTVQVSDFPLPPASRQFDLQYAERGGGSCSAVASSSWTDVGQPASSTPWRGYNASPSDGATLTSLLITSVSDATGTYEEANPSALNPYEVGVGDDVEYDWVVQNNNATSGAAYCFRMAETDGSPLAGYNNYPTVVTASYAAASQHWQWFDDEDNETPTVSLANENVTPSDISFDNIIKLRMTITDTNGAAANNVKFRLQFSEYSDFSQAVRDVEEIGSCVNGDSLWCYGDGAADADDDPVSTGVLSDSSANGVHNETGSSTSTFDPQASTPTEFEFTIRQAGARANTVYYFRAYNHTDNVAVPLNGTSTYPSLSTEGAQLVFTIEGLPSGTSTEGVVTDVTSTDTGIAFGDLPFDTEVEAAQRLRVTTNATRGYQVFIYQRNGLVRTGGDEIDPVSTTNESPDTWAAACSATSTGCYGYHTEDPSLEGGSTRFFVDNTYARLESVAKEIAYNSGPVTDETTDVVYKLQVNDQQPGGTYESSIVYIITPTF